MKILIADDEADIRMLLALSLGEIAGASIVEARNGREAVAVAEREQPDLIVLDAIMPGMSGPDAVPLIRVVSPSSTIYLFSAISNTQLEDYGRSLGVLVYPKTRIPDLIEKITALACSA
jgi:CheY-like chemotaxis protein